MGRLIVDRRRLVTLGLILVLLLLALFTSPLGKRLWERRQTLTRLPAALAPAAPAPPPPPPPVLAKAELEAWRQQHGSGGTRDPFFTAAEERPRPVQVVVAPPPAPAPVAAVVAPPTYTVKMVLISGAARVAAIDGRIVSEGEMLGDERVVEIQTGGVVLERGGHRRVVEVAGGAAPAIEVAPR